MGSIALFLAALLVGIPLLTLLHELGHGVAAACAVGGRVAVLQGPEPRRLELAVWRLDLRLHGPVAPHKAWIGWARWTPHPETWRHVIALAGGPAVSAAASVGCLEGAAHAGGVGHWILLALGLDAAAQFLSSSLPVRYPGFAGAYAGRGSDGRLIRLLVTGERPHPGRQPLAGSAPGSVGVDRSAERAEAPAPAAARS